MVVRRHQYYYQLFWDFGYRSFKMITFLKDGMLDEKMISRLDLRSRISKERGTACNLDSEAGYTKYDQISGALLDHIEKAMNQQEVDRIVDKAFIDQIFDNRIFKILK